MEKKITQEEVNELYKTNNDFIGYVERYCKTYKKDVNKALMERPVHDAAEYYQDAQNGKINVTEALYGCGSGGIK